MKARTQRDFLGKVTEAAFLGAVLLSLGACAPHGSWPNLASVPPRAEAFRPTEAPKSVTKTMTVADQAQARGQILAELGNIRDNLAALDGQFGAAGTHIGGEVADYEKAIRQLASAGAVTGGSESLTTAQLYLSRLTRTRDALRTINDKVESTGRDLLETRAGIAALKSDDLAGQAGDLSEKLARLSDAVTRRINEFSPYAVGELARMRLLSHDEASDAVQESPPEGEGAPVMVWQAGQGEAAYHAALEQVLAGRGDKTKPEFLVQAVGNDQALADRNNLLIKAMTDLVKAGVPLQHILLAVKNDPAAAVLELRLYIRDSR